MTKNDVIILSNSTLSTLSCILSNQLGLFNNQLFPNKLKNILKILKRFKVYIKKILFTFFLKSI